MGVVARHYLEEAAITGIGFSLPQLKRGREYHVCRLSGTRIDLRFLRVNLHPAPLGT